MKNALILILLITMTKTFAGPGEIISWANQSDKIFNYFTKPSLEITLSELNAGSDEFYGVMTIKTKVETPTKEELEAQARGLKLKNIEARTKSDTASLSFGDMLEIFHIDILNTPSGVAIDTSLFLTKSQFKNIKKNKNARLALDLYATPLISKKVKTITLPKNTCENLFLKGNKLIDITTEYLKLQNKIDQMQLNNKYSTDLLSQVESHCFESKDVFATSFKELLSAKLEKSNSIQSIATDIFESQFEQFDIELELNSTVEIE